MSHLKAPKHMEKGELKSFHNRLNKALETSDGFDLDLSPMESFDIFGLQLLISASLKHQKPIVLSPESQALRIKAMMDFAGFPWTPYFRIKEA